MRRCRTPAICLALALASALARLPRAAAAGPEQADLKAAADAAFDRRSYAQALEKYLAALAVGRDARLHYNIAQTLTALERYPEALISYQAFLSEAPAGTLTAAQQEKFFALLDDLKGRIARLDVLCDVAGARLLVRDRAIGTLPLAGPVSVNAGPVKVEVLAEGFKPFVANMTLAGGGAEKLTVRLERVDFTGALTVKSALPGTQVIIDGTARGAAPLVLRIDRGTHVVLGKADAHLDVSATVTIEPGGSREVSFAPARAPDYTVAYVGFGLGGVGVAAGTVTGILAFTKLGSAKALCDTKAKQCGPEGQPALQASKTFGILSSVAFTAGAAGAGVGVAGVVTGRRRGAAAKTVEVVVLPGGLRITGSL